VNNWAQFVSTVCIAVFLTVAGHLSVNHESYLYLIDQLQPKAVYLVGGDQATEQYPGCNHDLYWVSTDTVLALRSTTSPSLENYK